MLMNECCFGNRGLIPSGSFQMSCKMLYQLSHGNWGIQLSTIIRLPWVYYILASLGAAVLLALKKSVRQRNKDTGSCHEKLLACSGNVTKTTSELRSG